MKRFLHENNLLHLIAFGPLIFIPSVVLLISFLVVSLQKENFERNLANLKKNLLNERRIAVRTKVHSAVDLITYQKSIIKQDLMSRVKTRVKDAHKIATAIYEKYKDSKSKAQIQDIIVTTLRSLEWNGGESFIWILDFEGVFHLAPEYLRHLEGGDAPSSTFKTLRDAT